MKNLFESGNVVSGKNVVTGEIKEFVILDYAIDYDGCPFQILSENPLESGDEDYVVNELLYCHEMELYFNYAEDKLYVIDKSLLDKFFAERAHEDIVNETKYYTVFKLEIGRKSYYRAYYKHEEEDTNPADISFDSLTFIQ